MKYHAETEARRATQARPFGRMFVAALTLALTGFAADARTLTGTVTYRERMALPPDAAVEVKLVDVSRADTASNVIATTTIRPAGQVPVRWLLTFDDNKIVAGRRYALQARIAVGGALWFVTTRHHPVFAGGTDQTDILVQRVAQQATVPDSPAGRWLAEDIGGGGVIDRLRTVLEIAPDGSVSGTGGCNRMTGHASFSGETLTFRGIASTEMACSPAVMTQEQKFLAALGRVRNWRVDPRRHKLILSDVEGKPLVVLARM